MLGNLKDFEARINELEIECMTGDPSKAVALNVFTSTMAIYYQYTNSDKHNVNQDIVDKASFVLSEIEDITEVAKEALMLLTISRSFCKTSEHTMRLLVSDMLAYVEYNIHQFYETPEYIY